MKRASLIGAGFLGGAILGYLAAVWMAGYFYSPFEPSPRTFDGTAGTRYVMLCLAIGGSVLASLFAEDWDA